MKKLMLILILLPTLLFSQTKKQRKALEAQRKADQAVITSLTNHVSFLSKENNGSSADNKTTTVVNYISEQFKAAGLQPAGTNGYVHEFSVRDGKAIDASTYLKVNDSLLEINKDFFPLAYSASKKVTGMPAMALRERNVPWFQDIKTWVDEGSKTPGFNLQQTIQKEVTKVAAKGASALFLYNTGLKNDSLKFDGKDVASLSSIPVVYITKEGLKNHFKDHSDILDIDLNVSLKEVVLTGNNIIGSLNNGAAHNVVITGHYGEGDTKSTVANNSDAAILIELAKQLSSSTAKANNYFFLAINDGVPGEHGIKEWLEKQAAGTVVNYFVTLNNVALTEENKKVILSKLETSSNWNDIASLNNNSGFSITLDSTSVDEGVNKYLVQKRIPVLSISATDEGVTTLEKISYESELKLIKYIVRVVELANNKGKLAFTKATSAAVISPELSQVQPSVEPVKDSLPLPRRNTVSLGVIPEPAVKAPGLKIKGVSPKKIGAQIGLQAGDILTALGEYPITDIKTYILALGHFKAGDKAVLKIKRGKEDKEFAIVF